MNKEPEIDSDAFEALKRANPGVAVRFIPAHGRPLDYRQLHGDERAVWIPEEDGSAVVRGPKEVE